MSTKTDDLLLTMIISLYHGLSEAGQMKLANAARKTMEQETQQVAKMTRAISRELKAKKQVKTAGK